MNAALQAETLLPEGGATASAFYDSLLAELAALREGSSEVEKSFGGTRPLSQVELIEWLKFQCWYEREAAGFIGSWLRDTPEPEAFFGLCRQVADEGRHWKLITSHLESLGTSMAGWEPEPEWIAWVREFYASGDDTLERIAAHNITGEIGVMNAFEGLLPRLPEDTRRVMDKIIPDEAFHIALGRMVVSRYATTPDAQARVRARVLQAFALEQRGRAAYDRRLQRLSAASQASEQPVVLLDIEEQRHWICKVCGWIYDEEAGDPDSGIAPGTRFEDIPEDWVCPDCLVTKSDFVLLTV